MSMKIDELVAEKVMGLVPCGNPTMFARGAGLKGYPAKPYSTYIAEAWEVVEKMRERRPLVNLMNDGWHCRMKVEGLDEEVYIDGQAVAFTQPSVHSNGCDTAPLAICLAALRAVGVSESEIEAARNQTKGTQ